MQSVDAIYPKNPEKSRPWDTLLSYPHARLVPKMTSLTQPTKKVSNDRVQDPDGWMRLVPWIPSVCGDAKAIGRSGKAEVWVAEANEH